MRVSEAMTVSLMCHSSFYVLDIVFYVVIRYSHINVVLILAGKHFLELAFSLSDFLPTHQSISKAVVRCVHRRCHGVGKESASIDHNNFGSSPLWPGNFSDLPRQKAFNR